jgi:hypothetical protein
MVLLILTMQGPVPAIALWSTVGSTLAWSTRGEHPCWTRSPSCTAGGQCNTEDESVGAGRYIGTHDYTTLLGHMLMCRQVACSPCVR